MLEVLIKWQHVFPIALGPSSRKMVISSSRTSCWETSQSTLARCIRSHKIKIPFQIRSKSKRSIDSSNTIEGYPGSLRPRFLKFLPEGQSGDALSLHGIERNLNADKSQEVFIERVQVCCFQPVAHASVAPIVLGTRLTLFILISCLWRPLWN